ncbi:sigma-54-dependent transcriptional regulator [Dysosmobacter sp.]|uniref:sigma-54-dependent transcriptional regulator n=1 Tax=Dysosmobacter sp. TaxID=2591382 RepID=UPI002A8C9598|nr:PrpR N-terminal domain-containing protein [Dysosmobacter sp.]MDY3984053.1 PrpR N-terminal domain-containing protein [Dysosmobacter sp.]
MSNRIRVLGIAPYEGMKTLMSRVVEDYPQIDLTLFVGDMEQGLEIARSNFHGNYDVVISRGGTAKILRKNLALPVIEIDISMYDILCALRLADGLTGKIAMVSFANCTSSAQLLCDLMRYDMDIYTLESSEDVEPTLRQLQRNNYQSILCDMMANATAKRLGLNSFLITSGPDSIRKAFDQALLLCRSQQRLRDENLFFRELIQGQISQTVVFDQEGNLFLSTPDDPKPELLELLRRELPESQLEAERRITRNLGGMLYAIRARRISSGSLTYTAFFFDARKTPLSPSQVGIRFSTRPEAENAFYSSIFSFAGSISDLQQDIEQISQSTTPVMVTGEDGTGKESIVSVLYMRGPLRNAPLVSINCSLLNDKSWAFLLEHHNSPLADQGNTLYFASIDALSQERRQQLLAVLSEMDVCRRNRVIFSCVCQPGEYTSAVGSLFMDKLCCLSLYLPPLRQMAERIPTLVNLSLSHLNADMPRQIMGAEPEALTLLQNFQWPHNYTQFRRVIGELAVTASGPFITVENVRQALRKERHVGAFSPHAENAAVPLNLNRTLNEISQDVALRVMEETGGNQTAAAKRLGISRTTLWRLLQK